MKRPHNFITEEKALIKFKEKYSNLYDYSNIQYIDWNKPIEIYCTKHSNYFSTTPYLHFNRGSGCKQCTSDKISDKKKISKKENIKLFKKTHGTRYNYSDFENLGDNIKSKIICKIHGVFLQTPHSHKSGQGCPKCNYKTLDERLSQFEEIHGTKYDYSLMNLDEILLGKVSIICNNHQEKFIFNQLIINHLQGKGCPKCNSAWGSKERYKDKKTILYYIEIEKVYKIGITIFTKDLAFSLYKRFGKLNYNLIDYKIFNDGSKAFEKEQDIIYSNKKFKYLGKKVISSGHSECFSEDILSGKIKA